MTFVAAQKFNQRIILIADTKVTDCTGITRPNREVVRANNYVPGRLKAFPITSKISVGYAGLSAQALDTIRQIKEDLDTEDDLANVLRMLKDGSSSGKVEFLVTSHVHGPQIFKISNDSISADQEFHWIGDSEIAPLLTKSIEAMVVQEQRAVSQEQRTLSDEYGTPEEWRLIRAWMDLLLKAPTLTDLVGGLPVILLCSPYGHCFQATAGAYNPGPIRIDGGGTITNKDGLRTGGLNGQYSFSFVGGPTRGTSILGVWLRESQTGYVYAPLVADEPAHYYPITLERLRGIVYR